MRDVQFGSEHMPYEQAEERYNEELGPVSANEWKIYAEHEAAHAVTAHHYGLYVHSIAIGPMTMMCMDRDTISPGLTVYDPSPDLLQLIPKGKPEWMSLPFDLKQALSARLFFNLAGPAWDELKGVRNADISHADFDWPRALFSKLSSDRTEGQWLRLLLERTKTLLQMPANSSQVEYLGEILLQAKCITGSEIKARLEWFNEGKKAA